MNTEDNKLFIDKLKSHKKTWKEFQEWYQEKFKTPSDRFENLLFSYQLGVFVEFIQENMDNRVPFSIMVKCCHDINNYKSEINKQFEKINELL